MNISIIFIRIILLIFLVQPSLPGLVQAGQNNADHRLIFFFSNNVLGELEPCG